MFGLTPWFAFLRRALVFFLVRFFDGIRAYMIVGPSRPLETASDDSYAGGSDAAATAKVIATDTDTLRLCWR
jgi:hypothetical protein